jgi:hypothetical protein
MGSRTELDQDNAIGIDAVELSPEDRQVMEDFMKKQVEQDRLVINVL